MAIYSALVDTASGVLLTLSDHVSAIVLLHECTPESNHATYVNSKYTSGFPLATIDPNEYPQWTWDRSMRMFGPTRSDVLNDDLRQRSHLATEKSLAFSTIMYSIGRARYPVRSGIEFQGDIYRLKKEEALAFKKIGDESRLSEFPFLLQYADFSGLSGEAAADEILLKAKLDEQILLKTEGLRLVYLNKIKAAQNSSDIASAMDAFRRERVINALI